MISAVPAGMAPGRKAGEPTLLILMEYAAGKTLVEYIPSEG